MLSRLAMLMFLALLLSCTAAADHVGGLDPNGDNYLTLREGPGSKFGEVMRMTPDTVVTVMEQQGSWKHVRLDDGTEGWAFGKYIVPGMPAAAEQQTPAPQGNEAEGQYDVAPVVEAPAPPDAAGSTDIAQSATVDVDGIAADIARGLDEQD